MFCTWHDSVQHILRAAGLDGSDNTSLSVAKESAQAAAHLIANARKWNSAYSNYRVITSEPYDTGTITYTASTRTLTLAGGTWPTWAAYGTVTIEDVQYRVDRRVSDSVLILDSSESPSANVAAGTAYTIARDEYPLPDDFGTEYRTCRVSSFDLEYLSPSDLLSARTSREITNTPRFWTLLPDSHRPDRQSFVIYPASATEELIDLRYRRRPTEFTVYDDTTGTATTVLGDNAVTGSGTSWTSRLVGSVIRFSNSSTDAAGDRYSSTPFYTEGIVASVASTTSLFLESPAEAAVTGSKLRISSRADIGNGAMMSAYLAACLWQFEQRRGNTERTGKCYQNYASILKHAATEDANVGPSSGRMTSTILDVMRVSSLYSQF